VLRPANVLGGFLTFAVPVLLVLGIHEMGHYIVARRHGLRPTLPFFIPFPSFGGLSLGTLGAFIAMRDPMPDRKTLFDVGASGPIAGFLVAVPLVLAGAWMTQSAGHEAPDLHRPEVDLPTGVVEAAGRGRAELRLDDGTRHLLAVTAPQENTGRIDYTLRLTYGLPGGVRGEDVSVLRLEPGRTAHRLLQVPGNATGAQASLEWDDGLRGFGDPLLVRSFRWFGLESDGLLSHPTYIAGWVGLLVTGINLLPVSQLDGGHVARAVLGERMKYAAFGAITLLLVLTYLFRTWLILALFIVLMGIHHPPPLNDRTPLDRKRLALAVVVLLILVLTFVPVPFQM